MSSGRTRSHGLYRTWVIATLRRRTGPVLATSLGVALAVALLASLGAFLSSSKATMTRRAIDSVAVDWQVEAQPGSDSAQLAADVGATARVAAAEVVEFATTSGFDTTTGNTKQTTGMGQVVGISDTYRSTFPAEVRSLLGSDAGVLLFQQTAANLGASPGTVISIGRSGLQPVVLTVTGIVDLPEADSLFQAVGAPTGAQPQAPPDNVLIVPSPTWHKLFDALSVARPDLTRTQVHVRLDRHLPSDPAAAYSSITGQARNLEAQLGGAGLVGDNVAAALSGARGDALYAQILFLFLGTPGAALAALLTASVASSAADRRRREQALLRTRGATARQLVGLGVTDAITVGVIGAIAGISLARLVGRLAFHSATFGSTETSAMTWTIGAIVIGFAIAVITVALPARRDAHRTTVAESRRAIGRRQNPRWMAYGLDFLLLSASALVFWLTSRNGYTLVLAVEGVPTISVSYWAFAGPALLWAGGGLLIYRAVSLLLTRGQAVVAAGIKPVVGDLSDTVAASMGRQRRVLARGATLVALTVGFATSTAVFNSTYEHQARIDAILSNGADVTVTTSPGAIVSPSSATATAIAATAGVHHVEAIQHRFAYVGADLQDLYGVNAATIVAAGRLQNAYFAGGTAKDLIATLGARPDSLLVSAETVHDFQLHPGDPITLRLQDGRTKQYTNVPFHYVGVTKEFPTAPHDSFLIANAGYIAKMTGSDTVGAFLVDTRGADVAGVARRLRDVVGTSATVTDLVSTRRIVGSSLTAVDLSGLTKVELAFALALAAAATGLTLWMGLAERRRTFTIAAALGANRRQLGGFVWAEAGVTTLGGVVTGAVGAWALATMLVRVLTGVFDPAPEALTVPWAYLATVLSICVVASAIAGAATLRSARGLRLELLRTQ
ncbi:MAG: hypothetical protein JWN39_44 [Ilumatobacteraceae bacterium]|nr:hypothetical protein [Ilumatobacteraceae bacterium]